jgi:hypothetical protein
MGPGSTLAVRADARPASLSGTTAVGFADFKCQIAEGIRLIVLAALKHPSLASVASLWEQRAQGRPGAGRTHGPPANKKAGGSHHRLGLITRPSLRNGVTAYSALSPETGLSCPRRRAIISRDLTSASGGQDHTPSPSVLARSSARQARCDPTRPSHPAPNVRDDREAPSCERGTERMMLLIYVNVKRHFENQNPCAATGRCDGQPAHRPQARMCASGKARRRAFGCNMNRNFTFYCAARTTWRRIH